jgi:WD40 repeat protein/transcriptional regulator with XRE-family HTH domain
MDKQMQDSVPFGKLLQRLRLAQGITVAHIAQQVGCSERTIRSYEQSDRSPPAETARRLAQQLAIPQELHDLFVAAVRDLDALTALLASLQPGLQQSRQQAQATSPTHVEWGEAPDVSQFVGREREIVQLRNAVDARARLIGVFGVGGQGKTALTARFARAVVEQFDYVLWISLRNAPLLDDVLSMAISFFGDHQGLSRERLTSRDIAALLRLFAARRCLLVLDNFEAILQEGELAGTYRPGYAGFADLVTSVAQSEHKSCLVITSREKPAELARLRNTAIHTLDIAGFADTEGRAMLKHANLLGSDQDWQTFVSCYGGNPLSLLIVGEYIREIFDHRIAAFLETKRQVIGDVRTVLEQQFVRLTALEQAVFYCLAIAREPVGLIDMLHMQPTFSVTHLIEALWSLRQRALAEHSAQEFTLQNVIMEFATERLVESMCRELLEHTMSLLQRFPLVQASTKEYIRESQLRVLLIPLLTRLERSLRQQDVVRRLHVLRAAAQQTLADNRGYAGGNLFNLLGHLDALRGSDFSRLVMWEADMRRSLVQDVNVRNCDFSRTAFRDIFRGLTAMACSPDGTLLAIGSDSGMIYLRQSADGLLLGVCSGHSGIIWSLAFSPDGQHLASGSYDHTFRVWDVRTTHCLVMRNDHHEYIRAVQFTFDGKALLTASEDCTIRLWDLATMHCLQRIEGSTWWSCATLSPDGRTLAAASYDRSIYLWDLVAQCWIGVLEGHTDVIWDLCFSFDGALLASCGSDLTIRLWDVSSRGCLHTLSGHSGGCTQVMFNNAGTLLVSGADDGIVRIWDTQAGQCLRLFIGHRDWIQGVALSADERTLITASYDQSLRFWDVSNGRCVREINGYSNPVFALAFHPDGELLVSAHGDGAMRVWSVTTQALVNTLHGHTNKVLSIAFSPDGKWLVSGSADHSVRLWNCNHWSCVSAWYEHMTDIFSVAFAPDNVTFASVSGDYTLCTWDVRTDTYTRKWTLRTQTANDELTLAFDTVGRRLAVSGLNGQADILDIHTGLIVYQTTAQEGMIRALAYNPDSSTLATGDSAGEVWLSDAKSGETQRQVKALNEWVMGLSFSPDGQLLASSGADRVVKIWQTATMECLATLEGHRDMVRGVAFSPDGRLIASASYDETLRLWDAQTYHCLAVLDVEPPYAGMDITGAKGLSVAQHQALLDLGAVDEHYT